MVLFRTVLFLIALKFFIVETVMARHKCPKVPAPPGVMGIISSTTLIPSGSTMAAARSSETSGCDKGHPSKDFYKPKKRRVALFLKENLNHVSQESSQGKGIHLDALSSLAGCKLHNENFGRILQKNYVNLFVPYELEQIKTFAKTKTDQIVERLLNFMKNSPLLSSRCNPV